MLSLSGYKRLLENLSTAVLLVDDQLCVSYLNPSAEMLLAISRSRAIGQPLAQIFIDSEGDGTLHKMARTLKTAHPFTKREAHLRVNSVDEVIVDYAVAALLTPNQPPELLIEIQQIDRLLRISREDAIMANHQVTKQLVRGVAHEIKNPLGEAEGDVNIIRDYDLSLPELTADPDQLIQAILNITGNALQALRENTKQKQEPSIILRTRAQRQFTIGAVRHRLVLRIDIVDNGPGIPPHLIDTIFYPMVTGRASGSGLGLAIAQDIIHLYHGLIECESRVGQTTFSIFLPLENGYASKR